MNTSVVYSQLFTYGTLAIPAVMEAITKRRFTHLPALLPGYERFKLRDHPYPGIIRTGRRFTTGRIYFGVDSVSLSRLDRFEGALYQRHWVQAQRGDGTTIAALVYLIPSQRKELLSRDDWDESGFVKNHLQQLLLDVRRQSMSF